MITVQVNLPDKNNQYKNIYYRSDERIIRKTLVNESNNIIKDYMYEYNKDKKIDLIVLFGEDHCTVIGLKKYFYYENSNRIKSTEEFKCDNGREIATQKMEHLYNDVDRTSTVTIYDHSDSPIGYLCYGYRDDDDFMSLLGCFNMKNEKVSYFDLEIERVF